MIASNDDGEIGAEAAAAVIAAALRTARDGRMAESAHLFADAMKAPGRNALPMGFAVQVLRQFGAGPLADWVSERAVSRGLDITAMTPGFATALASTDATKAAAIARRYEQVFARGAVNAGMIGNYAIALSRAGEWETLAALHPLERTILQRQVESVAGFASLEAFNAGVIAEIVEDARNQRFDGRHYMQGAVRYHGLHKIDRPALTALIAVAERAFADFLSAFAPRPDDPLARMRPMKRNIGAWANFYEADAYVELHLHHLGWLVAVYYPQIPEGWSGPDGAGTLKVEYPAHLGAVERTGSDPVWPEATIEPKPGLLVVMPGYCYHRSVPFTGPGRRIAVTIDHDIDRGFGSLPFAAEQA